jgi:putative ABC transport system permease protein
MDLIRLEPTDLALAAALVLALSLVSFRLGLGVEGRLLIAAARSALQLGLIGLVLKTLFGLDNPLLVGALALVMLFAAGYEVMARQQRRFTGFWGLGVGTLSMFVSSFGVALLGLLVIVQPTPWYHPQYVIPLLGMLLGNTMTGIAVSLEHLTQSAWRERGAIEARLTLGHVWSDAIAETRRNALRAGLIPIVNAMAAAGIVSLPGMMTGQILAGSPPLEAAKYQLLILLLIAGGTGFGAMAAVWIGARRLFDERERLRLDRLRDKR